MNKKLLLIIPALVLCASCSNNSSDKKNGPTIVLNETTLSLEEDATYQLTATVTNSTDSVNWTTSNNSIAYVSSGLVYAKTVGECDIIASIESVTASCHITVYEGDKGIYSITSESSYHIEKGTEQEIECEVHYNDAGIDRTANLNVNYISEDTRVFEVVNNTIKPVKAGTGYLLIATDKVEKRIPVVVYDKFINSTSDYLDMLKDRNLGVSYYLNTDLDFNGVNYIGPSTSVGSDNGATFRGKLEGAGHTVKNIIIDAYENKSYSLFGNIRNAVIKDVNFENVRFINTNNARNISGLTQKMIGVNTVIKNVYLDVSFDTTSINSSATRNILFNEYDNEPSVIDCPYYEDISNIVVNAKFDSSTPDAIGFNTMKYNAGAKLTNVFVNSAKTVINKQSGISVYNDEIDLVYYLNSSKVLGSEWNYSLNEIVLPRVGLGSFAITDTILTSINGNQELSGYHIIESYPFKESPYGQAFGDYATSTSRTTNELFVSWHAMNNATNPNEFKSISLADYNSLVFFAKCPEQKSITVKGADNKAVDVISYNPNCNAAWKKVEFMNNGDGTWSIKFDGNRLPSDYSYTNLNQFEFVFNQYRYYISELFAI